MGVVKSSDVLVQSKDGVGHAAMTMAVGIIVERINRLSQDDRTDLYELVKGLAVTENSEDVESIRVAMMEILDQKAGQAQRMDMDDGEVPPGLQKWMDYVGKRIRERRESAGLTQEELAARSGLPQSHISRLENSKHSPSRSTLEKIASALKISVAEFDPHESRQ
jgi:DNA-binding XRE family transcriptional regulator